MAEQPLIFALDASGKTAGVCVARGGEMLWQKTLNQGLTHSETLLALAQEAFAATGTGPKAVGLYAVTAGPGSFTGLRIGMSLVKGLALPHGTPAAGVSTLEAWAMAATLGPKPVAGRLITALDARRGEVYWAAFNTQNGLSRLTADAAGPAEQLAQSGALDAPKVFIVGDGAKICYNKYNCDYPLELAGQAAPLPVAAGAAMVARALWEKGAVENAAALRPRYLRLSQAERERRDRLEQKNRPCR